MRYIHEKLAADLSWILLWCRTEFHAFQIIIDNVHSKYDRISWDTKHLESASHRISNARLLVFLRLLLLLLHSSTIFLHIALKRKAFTKRPCKNAVKRNPCHRNGIFNLLFLFNGTLPTHLYELCIETSLFRILL